MIYIHSIRAKSLKNMLTNRIISVNESYNSGGIPHMQPLKGTFVSTYL